MLEYLWLPLLSLKTLLGFYISSTILAMGVTGLLFADFVFCILHTGELEKTDIFYFVLLALAVPFRNLVVVFNIFMSVRLLRDKDIDKILFIKFFSEIFMICILLYLILIGKQEDKLVVYKHKSTDILHTIGFSNSNTAGLFFFQFSLTLVLLWKRYNLNILAIVVLVLNYVIYKLCHGRTYYFSTIILVVLSLFIDTDFGYKVIKKYFKYLGLVLIALTITLPILAYTVPAFASLKGWMTGRLYYYYMVLSQLTPRSIITGLKYADDAPLDSSYVQMLLSGGAFMILYFLHIYRKSFDTEKSVVGKCDLSFLIAVCVAGFTESFFVGSGFTSTLFWLILVNRNRYTRTERLCYGQKE